MKIIFYIIIILFMIQTCTEKKKENLNVNDKSVVTDTVKINGTLLELVNNNGVGELKIISGKYKTSGTIQLQPPCYFLRYKGKLTTYKYLKYNIANTIIILGGTKTDRLNKIYGTQIQGILFRNDSVIVTKGILKDYSPIDKDIGVDEKDYWGFASGLYNN